MIGIVRLSFPFLLSLFYCLTLGTVVADEVVPQKPGATNSVEAGHSLHGEVFNEGPRQAAKLLSGTGKVKLKISSKKPEAQRFFNQGVGQLEGFWYFEAERSFRQVALLDTNCAMAYWGMAMANVNNSNRASGFIQRAFDIKTNATSRERLWIEAYHAYFTGKNPETDRRKDLVKALEKIIQKHPKELEAKTFLVFQIWENEGKGIPITSRETVDSMIQQVLAVTPLHPIHHACIHLWNYQQDEHALEAAARCGQSAPAIAHMWHMPGHTYSQLKRYDDAAWQQEASARTDHAYMEASRILPDQIHNFAHNNQWLCTDLLYCGRIHDAISLAKNMVELPRHPKYNTLNRKEDNTAYDKNNGSSLLGRNRLFDAFLNYELWPEMLELAETFYLEPTQLPEEQARRFYALGLAQFALGRTNEARQMMSSIEGCRKQLAQERYAAAEKAETDAKKDKKDTSEAMVKAMKQFSSRLERVDKYQEELNIWRLLAEGKTNDLPKLIEDTSDLPRTQRARLWHALGATTNIVKCSEDVIKNSTNQAPDLALACYLLWQASETNAAISAFKQLRKISSQFDLDTPIFSRLSPVANHLDLPNDWRVAAPKRKDIGKRPELETLGPFRWRPYNAPGWTLKDTNGRQYSMSEFKGKPVLMVFYLGSGCRHCLEQLDLLISARKEFQEQGINIMAVSTEDISGLARTADKLKKDGTLPFPIVSNESLDVFKEYRAYDDFEKMPLHGTFLVDGEGKVRWQDISYDPFTDLKFLANESRRLLAIGKEPLLVGNSSSENRNPKR
jgi:peroxiredoxin